MKSFFLAPVLTLGLLALSGCETAPGTTDKGAYTTSKSGIQQADSLAEKAMSLPVAERNPLLLQAADIYITENHLARAKQSLDKVDEAALSKADATLFKLLTGELALQTKDFDQADALIRASEQTDNISALPANLRIRWHQARGELFALTGDNPRSIYELTRLAPLLTAKDRVQEVHDNIWLALEELSTAEITRGVQQSSDSILSGWYELAAKSRESRGDITLLIQNVRQWQQHNPGHPATLMPPQNLQKLTALSVFTAKKVAVLLPKGGELQLAAETLTDGILSAYYESLRNGSDVPQMRFYDTNAENIIALYQRAVSDGAELVIGPLQREQLAELMNQPTLPVPVLGLNYVEDVANKHDNFYQFGLSIRDEASQIAERGRESGYSTAMMVIPQSRLGESAADAFTAEWLASGGKLAASVSYNDSVVDYASLLEPKLLIGQSKQRATRLQGLLGKNVDFTPRRRGDVDMVVLVSHPNQGRQIKPALDYMYAADLPVLSTSNIYGSARNPGLDRDLEDIVFTAMPWSMKEFSAGMISPPGNLPAAYKNLFAMGVDAYRLHQWLDLLKNLPHNEIAGLTGKLSMKAGNQVQRRLPWARFKDGLAITAPLMSAQESIAP